MQRQNRGFSMIEMQIAFIALSIGLIGMGPLVITQVKQLRTLDNQLSEKTTYFFVPSTDPWVQKLGAAATLATAAPGPGSSPAPVSSVNDLNVLSLDVSPSGDEMTATIALTAIPL